MPRALWGALLLARPGNGLMAAAGVVAGGLASSPQPFLESLGLAAVAAILGIAGGNAFNDAADAQIDARAHPNRPIPRGLVTIPQARKIGVLYFAAALALLSATHPVAFVLGFLFVAGLAGYELDLKRRGVTGNLLIAALVGGTFLLGAVAAEARHASLGFVSLEAVGAGAAAMALLAATATMARELFKDVQDAEFDLAWRRTLPHRIGARPTLVLARLLLGIGIALGVLPAFFDWFVSFYVWLILPALGFFVLAIGSRDPGRASSLAKLGMVLALPAFVVSGILSLPGGG